MDLLESIDDLVLGIASSLIAAILVAVVAVLARRRLRRLPKYHYMVRMKGYLKRLKHEIAAKANPAVGVLMAKAALTSATHLFVGNRTDVTLDEYGDLLKESLSNSLAEGVFIARTRPSDWYARGDLGARIKEYWNIQKEIKNNLKGKVRFRRYIISDREIWENDSDKEKLIEDHKTACIELYFCEMKFLPRDFPLSYDNNVFDTAIFKCTRGLMWAILGRFDEQTVAAYLEGGVFTFRVWVEDDQGVLQNWYSHMLDTLQRNSDKLA